MPIDDYDLMVAIGKGAFWLKLKKLRALGLIKWDRFPHIELTDEGRGEVKSPVYKPPTKKQVAQIEELGFNLAVRLYALFIDPKNRGSEFVWPDTLRKTVKEFAEIHADTSNLTRYKMLVVAAADRSLETLLRSKSPKK
jgi:hypothetical protein